MALVRFYKPTLRRRDMDAVLQTMVDEKIGPGERRKQFLKLMAEYLNLKDGIAVRSYTDALRAALTALALNEGDSVGVSILSPEIYRVVLSDMNLKMVLLDISSEDGCISAEEATKAEGLKAILLHEPLSQLPVSFSEATLSIPIIEDITQSIGSSYKNLQAGTIGNIVVCALEEESLISTGGGAVVLSKKSEYIEIIKKYARRYDPYFELADMNAALGIVQLTNCEENLKKSRDLYNLFTQAAMKSDVKLFGMRNLDFLSSGYSFPIIANSKPDDLISFAAKYTVSVKRSFTTSVGINYQDKFDLYPNGVIPLSRGVSFPLYPFLQPKETEAIIKVLSHLPQ